MKLLLSFIPALLGAMIVLQAGLNRRASAIWNLPAAVLLNGSIVLLIALGAYAWSQSHGAETLRLERFQWWFVLPGVIGTVLIFGGPWAISRWGAVHTFVLLLSAQLLTSLVWDAVAEGTPPSKHRLAGVAVAWLGALIATCAK